MMKSWRRCWGSLVCFEYNHDDGYFLLGELRLVSRYTDHTEESNIALELI